jgi:aldehyde dehydrogenase (NAD+)
METYKNFINGEWVESSSQKRTKNLNPANPSDVIGIVPLSTAEEIQTAISAAQRALPAWRSTPAPEPACWKSRARTGLET